MADHKPRESWWLKGCALATPSVQYVLLIASPQNSLRLTIKAHCGGRVPAGHCYFKLIQIHDTYCLQKCLHYFKKILQTIVPTLDGNKPFDVK